MDSIVIGNHESNRFNQEFSLPFKWVEAYLSPFSGSTYRVTHLSSNQRDLTVTKDPDYQYSFLSTAIKIVSYLATAFILPTLALIVQSYYRSTYNITWQESANTLLDSEPETSLPASSPLSSPRPNSRFNISMFAENVQKAFELCKKDKVTIDEKPIVNFLVSLPPLLKQKIAECADLKMSADSFVESSKEYCNENGKEFVKKEFNELKRSFVETLKRANNELESTVDEQQTD